MADKIKMMDLVEGRASTKDVQFGWQMRMFNHGGNGKPLAVWFDVVNVEYPKGKEECGKIIASPEWPAIKAKLETMRPSIAELGKAELKRRGYDRFVIFGHADEVGDLTRARKYFEGHGVKDADADALFEAAVASGDIPAEEVDRLRK